MMKQRGETVSSYRNNYTYWSVDLTEKKISIYFSNKKSHEFRGFF